jgi:hypothetical protein
VTDFVSKLADTVLWSSIGAAVRGLIIKLTAEPYIIGIHLTSLHPKIID